MFKILNKINRIRKWILKYVTKDRNLCVSLLTKLCKQKQFSFDSNSARSSRVSSMEGSNECNDDIGINMNLQLILNLNEFVPPLSTRMT